MIDFDNYDTAELRAGETMELFGSLALSVIREKDGYPFTVFVVTYSLFYLLLSVSNVVYHLAGWAGMGGRSQ